MAEAEKKKRFSEAMTALASTFGVEASKPWMQGMWFGLNDLPLEDLRRAVTRAIRELRHIPRPVELRALAGQMADSDRAVLAWGAVQCAVGRYGKYRSVDFDDPLINAAIRNMGGWVSLCSKDVEEFGKWARKDFEKIYSTLATTGVPEEAAQYLAGIAEQQNTAAGFEVPKPVIVSTGLPPHAGEVVHRLGPADIARALSGAETYAERAADETKATPREPLPTPFESPPKGVV